ncbi:MAG: hypothetical protein M0C28_18380 [Candidatus Moduliflexus flocculans]|nr:hypothetical protein [Candidatus Moduliflexus flocculans]
MRKILIDVLIGIATCRSSSVVLQLFVSFLYDTGVDLDADPAARLRLVNLMYLTSAVPSLAMPTGLRRIPAQDNGQVRTPFGAP